MAGKASGLPKEMKEYGLVEREGFIGKLDTTGPTDTLWQATDGGYLRYDFISGAYRQVPFRILTSGITDYYGPTREARPRYDPTDEQLDNIGAERTRLWVWPTDAVHATYAEALRNRESGYKGAVGEPPNQDFIDQLNKGAMSAEDTDRAVASGGDPNKGIPTGFLDEAKGETPESALKARLPKKG